MAGTVNELKPITRGGQGLIGLNVARYVNARVLAASTAESLAVPAGARYVLLTANADFWADFTTTAAIPATDITDGSSPLLNPSLRALEGTTTISVISATVCIVTAEFYK
jgi:D-arabinose 1-dehydrogenase-like Zn-dependent alcohol dehydrogenase